MRNKSVLFILIIIILFSGCGFSRHRAVYDISLTEVERPLDAKQRYGESRIVRFEEEGKTRYSFEDNMIKIIWIPTSERFFFSLKNKTTHSIKIIWDETVYVDENGMSKRVMHSGIRYIDRNKSQPPTNIVRGATISDLIFPTDNVYFTSYWHKKPLFPNYIFSTEEKNGSEELLNKAKPLLGRSVQVLLPLQIEDVVNEYIFAFKINDVRIKQE